MRFTLAVTMALGLSLAGAKAQELPRAAADSVGLSEDQLNRLTERLREDILSRKIPGAVVLILRDGKIGYFEAFGERDPRDGVAMTDDTIFRIYSMTKPITSVVAMQLVEEGRLGLSDPVSKYVPAFAEPRVGVESTVDGASFVDEYPAVREPTVHDLLRHTSGVTYGVFGSGAIRDMYKEFGIPEGTMSAFDQAVAIGQLPLTFDPGTGWEYSRATDILGAVIEVVEEAPLDQVFARRVFEPLGMSDTGFWVDDPEKLTRVAQPFDEDAGGRDELLDPTTKPVYLSGGGGLFSTARDYSRFLAMLMNGGELDGVRILGPRTVATMTADHLGAIPRGAPEGVPSIGYLPGPGYGFGLGFAVRTDLGVAPTLGAVGEYFWGGYAGTYFWVSPADDLAVVFMMQSVTQRVPYRPVLRNMIYPAVLPLPDAAPAVATTAQASVPAETQ